MNILPRRFLLSILAVLSLGLGSARAATDSAVGLALEIDNGKGLPLKVAAGRTFYINQIDMRAHLKVSRDDDIAGLGRHGMLAGLSWAGVRMEQEFVDLPNPDGTRTRRRFFSGAEWMNQPASFTITPVDAKGRAVGAAVSVDTGFDRAKPDRETMFINRFRAIQWAYDCASEMDCRKARKYEEEGLVELRHSRHPEQTFQLPAGTKALQLRWSLTPAAAYMIPVTQVKSPEFAYGYGIAVEALTPPGADGSYAPGSDLTFRLSQFDGAGKRLHAEGRLPSYNDFLAGRDKAGLQYYRGFTEPAAAWYRRKHRERMLMAQIVGPAQALQPIRSLVRLEDFLGSNVTQKVGLPERDGYYGEFQLFPPSNDMFGGAFDPKHRGWAAPVTDRFTFHVPANAEPGTYLVTVKGRRVYLGEDIPASQTIEVQIGTTRHTEPRLTVGNCDKCHKDGGELAKLLHGNGNIAACNACHAPLTIEPDNEAYVRIHFIHSRSQRFTAPLDQCSACHLSNESIQRASKAACLSCHPAYPAKHVEKFGPLQSIYVGGGQESFQRCGEKCHTEHQGSGFNSVPQ